MEKLLKSKIPGGSVTYILQLWQQHPFNFTISKARKTCLGNYKYKDHLHFISVNGDSNPYSFLITLIHEIAHQHVTINRKIFKRKPSPHGIEWKTTFSKLMAPMLENDVFPEDIRVVLKKHMIDPAASSTSDPLLFKILENYSKENAGTMLSDIENGKIFAFKDKKYKKIENRRTRTLVECMHSRKKYTISSHAAIELLD